ncbi:C6 transcription factor-like protein [Aaosphaeria arxii CBS 175.79]|uniref:C6 transcription factor-like protein n=1 Tax=Aaosphaeria arxii CBS 175.79 TaxID=1450172 RepID=A0A6A5Y180_9PLEO|nr:C6 transcription factor-like protein [Aaosphaeria arxii CBS 175.79]KAF2018314.1 C6 transcription factor-like protein [Aaosphaeria arxii CBS 175.79]
MSSQRSTSMEAQDNIRKRVCKACDRCRLKKSKCDGASPCSRCKADNAICVFGERKKSQDKVYPKGYVEMLEQQQSQLVAGLRELYSRLQTGQGWPGAPLRDAQSGHPLTHDILERLDLLHPTSDSNSNYEGFEEDCSRMQRKLLERGAPYTRRRGSISSNSDHDHTSSSASSFSGTPTTRMLAYNDPFTRHMTPPTPPMQSPFPKQSQITPSVKQEQITPAAFMNNGALDPSALNRQTWEPMMMDEPIDFGKPMYPFDSYNSFDSNGMVLDPCVIPGAPMMSEWNEPSDLDFSSFIQNPMNA